MSTRQDVIQKVADQLLNAPQTTTPCPPFAETQQLTVEEAYGVQRLNIQRRLEGALAKQGERATRVVGHKIGITSHAVQSWLKVDQPDFGHLLDAMAVPAGGKVATDRMLQPRVEGEVAFVLGRDLKGPGVTAADVIGATDYVLPSIEIIDSRVADWKITYADTVADNASSGLFVLGQKPTPLADIDLELCGMALRKNGAIVSTGAGIACLDHPVNAVVWLANTLGALGETLEAGHIVLSGALGPVCDVSVGDVIDLDIAGLGSARVSFV
jgi:2-oxopent-4-enoate hydratase